MLQRVCSWCLLFQGWGRCVPTAVPQACEILYSEAKCVFILTIMALHEGNPWWTCSAGLLVVVAVEQAKNRTVPRLSAQHRLSFTYWWGTGTAPVSIQPCPFQHLVSASGTWCQCFPFSLFNLQIINSVLGSSLSSVWLSPSIRREELIQLYISPWAYNLTHSS